MMELWMLVSIFLGYPKEAGETVVSMNMSDEKRAQTVV